MESDDPRAAQREAWARWAAVDPKVADVVTPLGEMFDAFNEQDAVKWRALFADGLVVEDHRLAGIGRVDGADAYVATVVALWELAPATYGEGGWHWPAFDHYGAVTVMRRTGTIPDGGDFESEFLYLYLVAQGRITRAEIFEIDALDKALGRFEELRPPAPELAAAGADSLDIAPNAATRRLDQMHRRGRSASYDVSALRDTVTDDFCFDDRMRQSLVVGGVEELSRSLEFLVNETRARLDTRRVATAGDRLALDQCCWREAPGESRFEIENYRLVEVDAAGKVRALVFFSPEDRVAAFAETQKRFVAGEGAGCAALSLMNATLSVWHDRDWERLRTRIAEDGAICDHRRLGLGRLDRDEWIDSWLVGVELAPDVRIEALRILAWNEHGSVRHLRVYGTRDGGEFENVFLGVDIWDTERLWRFEFFEVEELERAHACFEANSRANSRTFLVC